MRVSVFGGRPKRLRCGNRGSIIAHSASLRSLEYPNPLRSYFERVILVHMLYLVDCLAQPSNHNTLKSRNSFSARHSAAAERAGGRYARLTRLMSLTTLSI